MRASCSRCPAASSVDCSTANAAVNLVSFVPCRFGGLAWIVYGMTQWNARVAQVYLYLLAVAIFVLSVTNAILFWRLICSDVLRRQRQVVAATDLTTSRIASATAVHCNGTATAVNGALSAGKDVKPECSQLQAPAGVVNGPASLRQRGVVKTALNGTV